MWILFAYMRTLGVILKKKIIFFVHFLRYYYRLLRDMHRIWSNLQVFFCKFLQYKKYEILKISSTINKYKHHDCTLINRLEINERLLLNYLVIFRAAIAT